MVGVSLDTLDGFMIGTGEVYFVGLSLVLSLGSPLDSLNPRSDMSGKLMGSPLGFCFGSGVV